jgi:hypothetical protein
MRLGASRLTGQSIEVGVGDILETGQGNNTK